MEVSTRLREQVSASDIRVTLGLADLSTSAEFNTVDRGGPPKPDFGAPLA